MSEKRKRVAMNNSFVVLFELRRELEKEFGTNAAMWLYYGVLMCELGAFIIHEAPDEGVLLDRIDSVTGDLRTAACDMFVKCQKRQRKTSSPT